MNSLQVNCMCQRRDAHENPYTAMQFDDKTGGRTSHLPTLMKKPNMEMYFLDADAPSKIPRQSNLKKISFAPCSVQLHIDNLQKVSAKTDYLLQHSVRTQGCKNFDLLLDLQSD